MKKVTIMLLLLFAIINLNAQNFYINFTASGASSTLDNVFVENLTQGTSLTIQGGDTLHLIGTVDVIKHHGNRYDIKVFPVPMEEKSYLEFYNSTSTKATIGIFDVTGKQIIHDIQQIEQGLNIFELSGFSSGMYLVNISTQMDNYQTRFVSVNENHSYPHVNFKGVTSYDNTSNMIKSTKNLVQMSYTTGNQMRFTGYSGSLNSIVSDVPTSSKTINFVFSNIVCGTLYTDTRDGNQYTSVQLGNQCWMTQNLRYLPSVSEGVTGNYTAPHYYVYGYNGTNVNDAKANPNYNTYGVLYNWPAAMAGSTGSSSNPSGVQGICPAGWRLPSDAEWTQLENYLADNGYNFDGSTGGGGAKIAKSVSSTTLWFNSYNTGAVGNNLSANNSSGFNAVPGGFRYQSSTSFSSIYDACSWWTTTENGSWEAWLRSISYNYSSVNRNYNYKDLGFYVRCVK